LITSFQENSSGEELYINILMS